MSIEWGTYRAFERSILGPPEDLSRRESKQLFDDVMYAIPERIREVTSLLRRNGVRVESDETGLDELEGWCREVVEPDPEQSQLMGPEWYNLSFDLALLLGQLMIGKHPGLKWVMPVALKSDVAYQHHAIGGFSRAPNKKMNMHVELGVATVGHRAIRGERRSTRKFIAWFAEAAIYA